MRAVLVALAAAALLAACGSLDPSSLEFVGVVPSEPRIGEITTVQFKATDSRGEPMAGVEVTFQLSGNASGVRLLAPTALTNKGTGIAETQIVASVGIASVVLVAQAGTKTVTTPPISFAGAAAPNARQLTFQCGEVSGVASGGVHAIGAFDPSRNMIAGVKLNCHAHVADRNGDSIPGAVVSFLTEAGTIGPSATSVTDVIGNADILYKSSLPLPDDTQPGTFTFTLANIDDNNAQPTLLAPLWMEPWQWRQNPVLDFNPATATKEEPRRQDPIRQKTFCPPANLSNCWLNPRDNLVTLIAVTTGEEGYIDVNANGQYDTGEPFDDLTEPFVDNNDNGYHDPDERWVDTNNNATFDGRNGVHDSNTLIWVAERILWTGLPDIADYSDTTTPIFRMVTPPPVIGHYQTVGVTVLMADPWFNTIAQNGDNDGCTIAAAQNSPVVASPTKFGFLGRRLIYRTPDLIDFGLTDAHDPTKQPPDPTWTARLGAPLGFKATIGCQYASSPVSGYVSVVPFYVVGTVD